jgi:hypothetical protein
MPGSNNTPSLPFGSQTWHHAAPKSLFSKAGS